MAFSIPNFNLAVRIWSNGTFPGAPRVNTLGNLTPGRRVQVQYWDWAISGQPALFMGLLLPAGTDIRGWNAGGGADTVEVPAGSGRVYLVNFVDDIGKGFGNEHRFAILEQLTPWPSPIP